MSRIEQTSDGQWSYKYYIQKSDGRLELITKIGSIEEIIKIKNQIEI